MHFSKLTLVLSLLLYVSKTAAVVVLSEVMFDPAGDESTDEYVELFNNSALPVQLAGWSISDGDGEDSLISAGQGLIAAPNQYVLIIDPDYIDEGSMTYDGLVPESALIVTISSSTFGSRGFSNSTSENVSLKNAAGVTLFEYQYSVNNVSGHSDEKIRLTGPDDATNWSNSTVVHGTPGFRNSVTPVERDLAIVTLAATPDFPAPGTTYILEFVIANLGLQTAAGEVRLSGDSTASGDTYIIDSFSISELAAGDSAAITDSLVMPESGIQLLLADLNPADDDTSNNRMTILLSSVVAGSGVQINEIQYAPRAGFAEWIELAVTGTVPVATRGMSLADGQGLSDTTKRAQLPELVLLPGEFVVVSTDSAVLNESIPFESQVVVAPASLFTLNNGGDSLTIFSASGEVLDRVDYRPNWGEGENGVSLERVSLAATSNDPSNWGASVDAYGSTPGRVNSRSIPLQELTTALSVSPSPFTPNGDGIDDVTEIRFLTGGHSGTVAIKIFDVRGRLVRRLSQAHAGSSGSLIWDGRKDNGTMAATARYIVSLDVEKEGGGVARDRTTVILARPK